MHLVIVVLLLVGISFFTLLEQNLLRYIQIRKGPNKVGFIGILQPFRDAIKLFSKEKLVRSNLYIRVYNLSPVLSLFVSLLIWVVFPLFFNVLNIWLGFLFIVCCIRVGVYFLLFAGWSSTRIYAYLGRIRAVAQTLSYEVCIILLFIYYFLLLGRYNLMDFFLFKSM